MIFLDKVDLKNHKPEIKPVQMASSINISSQKSKQSESHGR